METSCLPRDIMLRIHASCSKNPPLVQTFDLSRQETDFPHAWKRGRINARRTSGLQVHPILSRTLYITFPNQNLGWQLLATFWLSYTHQCSSTLDSLIELNKNEVLILHLPFQASLSIIIPSSLRLNSQLLKFILDKKINTSSDW